MAISQIVQNSISDAVQLGRDFVFKPTITAPANNTVNVVPVAGHVPCLERMRYLQAAQGG